MNYLIFRTIELPKEFPDYSVDYCESKIIPILETKEIIFNKKDMLGNMVIELMPEKHYKDKYDIQTFKLLIY